jgi:AAA+ ATPase superfamily predicted ATPase
MYQTTLPVVGAEFRDREEQLARILRAVEKLRAGAPEWLALLGSRKVGKTSLLLEASRQVGDQVVFAILDVFDHVPVTAEVIRLLVLRVVERVFARECGQSLEATIDPDSYRAVLAGSARFARLPGDLRQLLLGLRELDLAAPTLAALLQVPERLSEALDLAIVVAIDEFQELADLRVGRPARDVLPMLRSAWQKHRRVAYVVSGSARRMMTDLVASDRSPFFGHFALLEIDAFAEADAIALLVEGAVPDHAVSRQLAARAVATIGGNPFYLQLLGEQLAGLAPPLDEGALKEALSRLVFHRTGRLAMFFEAELARVVGRSAQALAILEQLARAPCRPADLQAALRLSSSSAVNYLARLGDVIRRRDDDRYELTDPVMALWLKWRAPGGAAVPMTVVGDDGERDVARALADLGFELVYQSKASRGAFDLLAIRAGVMVGVQVKRSALPLHFTAAAWKRMEAEARRLGWLWIVAAASPDGAVTFLDPARGRRRKGVGLSAPAAIVNLLAWVDDASTPRRRR